MNPSDIRSRVVHFLFLLMAILPGVVARADNAPAAKPIEALMITGGCCHDYTNQKMILSQGISARANVHWTLFQEDGDTHHELTIYNKPDWWKGYDIIVHNECYADVADPAFVAKALEPVRAGIPAVVIHCTLHTFRALPTNEWREFIGMTSTHHGAQLPIKVQVLKPGDPIMTGFPANWVSGPEELYSIDETWPNANVLAQAYAYDANPVQDQRENPVIWTNMYQGKTRVFGSSMAHNDYTMQDPVYLNMMARGLLWACGKLDDKGNPLPGYGPQPAAAK
jgi:type 1 glutamine amidotransferase